MFNHDAFDICKVSNKPSMTTTCNTDSPHQAQALSEKKNWMNTYRTTPRKHEHNRKWLFNLHLNSHAHTWVSLADPEKRFDLSMSHISCFDNWDSHIESVAVLCVENPFTKRQSQRPLTSPLKRSIFEWMRGNSAKLPFWMKPIKHSLITSSFCHQSSPPSKPIRI